MKDLKNAVQLVQTKAVNQSEASLTFNIPIGTLQLHLKNPGKKVGAGRPTDLTLHDEQIIANTTKASSKWGFGLTKQEFLKSVADYVSSNLIKTQFKENIPGDDWFLSFKKRHNIFLRVPEIKQSARFEMFIPERVLPFFTLLANEIKSNRLENKPSQIVNLETCFNHDPSKVKVLGEVGQTLNRRSIGSGRANTTALACVSASGQVFPPHIIFKSSNCTIRSEWKSDKCYPRTTYDSSESGWMTSETFFSYMKNVFIPGAPAERPLLIIVDGYLSHLSVDVIKLAFDNKLVLIKLPAHTTDQLQPLDKVMFRSLKEAFNRRLIKWQRENYGFTYRKCDLVEVIGDAWPAMTTQNVLKGFQATGFFDPSRKFPVNPQVIIDKFPKEQLENFKKTDGFKELVIACDIGPTEDEQRVGLPESPDSSMMEAQQNAVVPHLQRKESFESLMLRKLEALKELRRGNKKSRRDETSGEVVTSPEFFEKS
ncbi:uncharacterized protein LOC128984492 [Macrosteles quadrilineatus]|uniref:uncharacterized protein LOC128984492 n=1 Tax=Macrosteles quadrilineatus TaxID=74068 RepID=UPI0023E345CC|nr:uncharacterized protein LOC128984492 [Macrosteles quadrilineatus]